MKHQLTLINKRRGRLIKKTCLLLIMRSQAKSNHYSTAINVNTMWDSAATISLITNETVRKLGLKGQPVSLTIVKAGGTSENISSFKYTVNLYDECGVMVEFIVYGITKISTSIESINVASVIEMLPGTCNTDIIRPEGEVDILIGLDYAAFHPQMLQNKEHLVLYRNRFGKCLGGTHPRLVEGTERIIDSVYIHLVSASYLEDFYTAESVVTENCDYTIKEVRELRLISSGLKYNGKCWEANLPWIRDPNDLPNNEFVALSILKSTEKRILKNERIANAYKEAMNDMFTRGVARKLSELELNNYNGPVHYITHHEVLKADSQTTPLRIVFNTSLNFHGHILNEYWAKGPDIVNNMFGVFLRFREEKVAFVGDVSKMYHAVQMLNPVDQNTHRFLWRDLNLHTTPSTYVMTRISFGDRPAGIIANLALRKTGELGKEQYPRAYDTITRNAYVDDIIDSSEDITSAKKITTEIQNLLLKGNFHMKGWIFTGCNDEEIENSVEYNEDQSKNNLFSNGRPTQNSNYSSSSGAQKVLGMNWDYNQDTFFFTVKLNFSPKQRNIRTGPNILREEFPLGVPEILTKRIILQQVNGFYDVFGFATPFILKAKILLRSLWVGESKTLDWDEAIPVNEYKRWISFFDELYLMEDLTFPRCMKPENTVNEDPVLVIFSDASEVSYGAVAYVRWKLQDGTYCSKIMVSKSKLCPIKKITTVRLELNGAVIAKRLKECILKECRYKFQKVYFIVDSEIVLGMVQKDSYGFKTYVGVRVAEIQGSTNACDWYWIDGGRNIADWTTRGQNPNVLHANGLWQNGPNFLKLPESEWPTQQRCKLLELPEMKKKVMLLDVKNHNTNLIDIERFSKYNILIRTTCRVLTVLEKPNSMKNIGRNPETSDYEKAELFWIKQCQGQFCDKDMEKEFARLSPRKRQDEIWIVGTRAEKWMEASYNHKYQILLPFKHRFSRLYAEFVHNITHAGVLSTVSRIRLKYWIVNLQKMVKSIIYHCVPCKLKRQELMKQIMAPLPTERLKPAPAWHQISLDYFGPFVIKGEVNKRSRGKCFGLIFTCLITRGVHADITTDYTTDSFLMAFRRFVSIRGYPGIVFSDNGSQLKAASRELKSVLKNIDWDVIKMFGADKGLTWKFTSADAPWQNGCSESLIKSIKKALVQVIGKQVLLYSELQTVMLESANLMNERPIGTHPINPDDGKYLCPNDLMLGRADSRVPHGPFREYTNNKDRYSFVQHIVTSFWKKMIKSYFPSLIVRQKWHTERRNVEVGDIVMIQDKNSLRGQWRIGVVDKIKPSSDNIIRNCIVKYKKACPNRSFTKTFTKVDRPVQRLSLLVPNSKELLDDGLNCKVTHVIVLGVKQNKPDD